MSHSALSSLNSSLAGRCSPRPAHQNPHPHPLHRAGHCCPFRAPFWRNALVFFSLDDNTLQSIAAPTAGPNGTGDLLAKDTGISAPSSFTRTVSEPCVHSFPCRCLCAPVCYPVFVVHVHAYVCDKGRAIVTFESSGCSSRGIWFDVDIRRSVSLRSSTLQTSSRS